MLILFFLFIFFPAFSFPVFFVLFFSLLWFFFAGRGENADGSVVPEHHAHGVR